MSCIGGCGALSVLLATTLVAQQAPPCRRPLSETAPFERSQLEQPPVPDSGNPPPSYPPLLRQARVGGVARLAFVLDTLGRPIPRTVQVVRTPNPGFDDGLRRTIARWRFTPGRACGARAVPARLEAEFVFAAADSTDVALLFDDPPWDPLAAGTRASWRRQKSRRWRPCSRRCRSIRAASRTWFAWRQTQVRKRRTHRRTAWRA